MVIRQCEASTRVTLTPGLRGPAGCKATREHGVTAGTLWSVTPCGVGGTGVLVVLLRLKEKDSF